MQYVRNITFITVFVLLLTGTSVASSPAEAQPEQPAVSSDPSAWQTGSEDAYDAFYLEDHIIVEQFTILGVHIATTAYSHTGQELAVPKTFQSLGSVSANQSLIDKIMKDNSRSGGEVTALGSGSGGTSKANGCLRLTVRNKTSSTIFKKTLFRYNTWTEWCWNRSTKQTSSVSIGYYLSDVAFNLIWRGEVSLTEYHFFWYSGYPKSGHLHDRQGHFENCITRFGCINNNYPRNIIKVYSNGTWSWKTSD